MRDRIWISVLAAAFAAQAPAAVVNLDDVDYSVYRLDMDDAAAGPFSRATASNANGQVVGYYRLTTDAANVTARAFSALPDATGAYGPATRVSPLTGFTRVFPWDVNDSGVMVGTARVTGTQAVWYAYYGDPAVSIGGFATAGRFSEARGINNLGAAVGYVCSGGGDCLNVPGAGPATAFYYHPTSQPDPVLGFPNLQASASQARAINAQGLIAGSFVNDQHNRALRYDWAAQQGEDLHPYFGNAVSSEALAINGQGAVAGRAGFTDAGGGSGSGNTVQRAFVLEQGSTTPTVLATPAGYAGSAAAAIADNGWVVGTACASGTNCGRFEDTGASTKPEDNTAVLWANGLAIDLSLLPGLGDAGWAKLSFAESIVDMGMYSLIAGVGYFQVGAGLERSAFVLRIDESSVPIPEPGTYAMLAMGLLLLGAIRLRRAQ